MRPCCLRSTWCRMTTLLVFVPAGCFAPQATQTEHFNVAFAVSPDGQQIAFSAADGDLYLLALDAQRVSRLTKTDVTESSPKFSPDGKALVYAATVQGREGSWIFLRTLDGKQVRQLTDDAGVSDAAPSFSPDGVQVAFTRAYRHRPYSMGGWTWDNYDVCVINRDGTGLRRVTSHNYYQAGSPCFADGGQTLVFCAEGDGPGAQMSLFSVRADGSQEPKPLTAPPPLGANCGAWGSGPSASIDGKLITFVSDRASPYRYDIYVMTRAGTGVRQLGMSAVSRYNQQPVFMPDGKSIMFLAGTEANASSRPIFSLWKAGVDGGEPTRVAESKLFTDPIHWHAPSNTVQPTPTSHNSSPEGKRGKR